MQIEPIKKLCDYLIARAYPTYSKEKCGKCAAVVRAAAEFAFDPKKLDRVVSAKDYGASYEKLGFKKIFSYPKEAKEKYEPKIGDICIIQYEPHGHICALTSKGWISDFVQRDMYGGKIREENPPFNIYRLS